MSSVNDQVTDAVSQINTLMTGGAPSQSMGMLDVTGTETIGMSMFNAVTAQQNAQTSATAAITASCAKMLRTDTTPPPAVDAESKEALELKLAQLSLAEEKLENALILSTLSELAKSKKAVTSDSISTAFSSAKGLVKAKTQAAEQALLKKVEDSLEKTIEQVISGN
ncbi:RebB family R body protein [Marinomonas mediterranea]|jgi:Killing trait.|uniref:Uncharacterized protein n=1 Tax=Marinomonas mediterranea (strain ATCC 700492 / JCM 21426 / NBRC 103028 / MMB-1) TaxID=717774 RepID=F2JYC0_MARM1|nr:RebB family R body protein [Marinomonas mediterranea]ADZ91951.1 hypothetical protein Marme_2721 [Marinomonas mediterranea MMB-1]WCN09904.1 hypothetical protein GV055_13745 [Marinomonas mediterranea]WCN13984.1 hypothetical protein GV054_13735 [Marinomonas mediterranea]WCN18034.1 hypothetical protein GV053_13760 [Marinomonas mediterranea MMB-1]